VACDGWTDLNHLLSTGALACEAGHTAVIGVMINADRTKVPYCVRQRIQCINRVSAVTTKLTLCLPHLPLCPHCSSAGKPPMLTGS
jgi:hypothetical protein